MEVAYRVRTKDDGVTNKIRRLIKKCELRPKVLAREKTLITSGQKEQKSVLGTKRKYEHGLESEKVKGPKFDQCQAILSKLIRHKWSCPFRNPVDPKASGDYYQVIKHPMDLGTVKRKLQQNKYAGCEEFEIDVTLIFTNAMSYHPSNNWIHLYASKLNRLFNILWTPLKAKVIQEPIIKENLSSNNNNVKANNSPKSVPDLSPSKALRAAKLRSRFAETILRAQTKIDAQSGSATDLINSEELKERLRQKHDEEIARIETEVKAAELACQLKADCELKKRRQAEREAARINLKKMERSIDIDNNWRVMRDFETLIGKSMLVVCGDKNRRQSSALEQLGLFLKPEYRLEDDDERFFQGELEDGEIVD